MDDVELESTLSRLLKAEPAPPGLRERLMRAVANEPPPPESQVWFVFTGLPWRAAVLVGALALGIGFWAGWSGFGLDVEPSGEEAAMFYLGATYGLEELT